jgi:hypothetical protein
VQTASTKRLLHEQAHKLMVFEKFKARFGKFYETEGLSSARFHDVVASVFQYINGQSSYYNAINMMSDWHEHELRALEMKPRHSDTRSGAPRR